VNYIFDFDGTIADSLPAIIKVFNKTMRSDDNQLTTEEIANLRGLPTRRAISKVGVRWWQLPKLILKGMPEFKSMVSEMKPFPELPIVIKELYSRGDKLFIVTSNTEDSVRDFLKANQLENYFQDISSTNARLFNKSKYIRGLIKDNGLKRRETVYIGDETRDIQAARLAFIKVVSVTWGFNTRKILKRFRPSFLIDSPAELLNLAISKGR
jgi:phosphoglycolate phosphatase